MATKPVFTDVLIHLLKLPINAKKREVGKRFPRATLRSKDKQDTQRMGGASYWLVEAPRAYNAEWVEAQAFRLGGSLISSYAYVENW